MPLAWPIHAHPRLLRADRFPLADRDHTTQYHAPFHALHLYDYHADLRLGGERLAVRPGVLTLSPAGIATSYHLPQPGYHWCIHFTLAEPPLPADGQALLPLYLPLEEQQHLVAQQFAHIARLHARSFHTAPGRELAAPAASAALQSLLLWLALFQPPAAEAARSVRLEALMDRVAAHLQEHLAQPLDLPSLARWAGLSQNYLARCFRRQFGVPIPTYVLRRRVDVARLLLRSTDLPVKEVGGRVGLPDPQHFNKQFRRLVGVNPTAYRAGATRAEQAAAGPAPPR